jgi:hypothetical protein
MFKGLRLSFLMLSASALLGCATDPYEEQCIPYAEDAQEVVRERVLYPIKSLLLGASLECVSIPGAGGNDEACAIRLENQEDLFERLQEKGYVRNKTTFLPEGVKRAAINITSSSLIAYYKHPLHADHSIYVGEHPEYAVVFTPHSRCFGLWQVI